jgi:predicted acylesterase/phospholipase RssA
MSEDLLSLWAAMEPTSFYRNWRFGGIVRGFLFKQGLYDTSPLHEFIKAYFESRTIHRPLHINSVDAQTGDIVGFDETNTISDLITGLCASTAVPFVFPPVEY